jgi:hypothetical protein
MFLVMLGATSLQSERLTLLSASPAYHRTEIYAKTQVFVD